MTQDNKVQDLVAMLDQMMNDGCGHINVQVEGDGDTLSVETTNTTACSINSACAQPTELTLEEGDQDDK
ncbi:MAG: hypothetical protein R3Y57_02030 [Erysipelotrichaceae bacterium]